MVNATVSRQQNRMPVTDIFTGKVREKNSLIGNFSSEFHCGENGAAKRIRIGEMMIDFNQTPPGKTHHEYLVDQLIDETSGVVGLSKDSAELRSMADLVARNLADEGFMGAALSNLATIDRPEGGQLKLADTNSWIKITVAKDGFIIHKTTTAGNLIEYSREGKEVCRFGYVDGDAVRIDFTVFCHLSRTNALKRWVHEHIGSGKVPPSICSVHPVTCTIKTHSKSYQQAIVPKCASVWQSICDFFAQLFDSPRLFVHTPNQAAHEELNARCRTDIPAAGSQGNYISELVHNDQFVRVDPDYPDAYYKVPLIPYTQNRLRNIETEKASISLLGQLSDNLFALESEFYDINDKAMKRLESLMQKNTEVVAHRLMVADPVHKKRMDVDARRNEACRNINALSNEVVEGRILDALHFLRSNGLMNEAAELTRVINGDFDEIPFESNPVVLISFAIMRAMRDVEKVRGDRSNMENVQAAFSASAGALIADLTGDQRERLYGLIIDTFKCISATSESNVNAGEGIKNRSAKSYIDIRMDNAICFLEIVARSIELEMQSGAENMENKYNEVLRNNELEGGNPGEDVVLEDKEIKKDLIEESHVYVDAQFANPAMQYFIIR